MSIKAGVKFIGKTIGDILEVIKTDDDLYMLESWLESGGDIDVLCQGTDKYGASYLLNKIQWTINSDELLTKIFEILVRHGVDKTRHYAHELYGSGYFSLISTAILQNHKILAKHLFYEGFDLCASNNTNLMEMPALTTAAYAGNTDIIDEFVKQNIQKIDYYTPNNCNPICAAIITGKLHIIRYLMENGVSYYPCPHHPNALLTKVEILNLILSADSFFMLNVEKLYQASQYYIYNRKLEEATLIIHFLGTNAVERERILLHNKESSRNSEVYLGKSLLVLATERELLSVMEILIGYKYDVNLEDSDGWTAFITACAYGNDKIIRYLYAKGAIVNKADSLGKTGLHLAAQNGHSNAVRVILECGGNSHLKCSKGKIPLDYAVYNNRVEILHVLNPHDSKCRII